MSDRVLQRLARMNKTAAFLGAAVLVFLGLLLPGIVGATVLILIAVGLVWVLTKTWPVTPAPARVPRVLILTLLVVVAAYKAS
ncbi:hypothetical protein Dvina_46515 [Dactylosporangium vinaceum]|uniref:DUF6703 family protein n=1 Tax=Dactylosporangium vinaceum TaxID=53362 RepID=A0ABV5M7I2_9ACTN|nr:DUF6703 family protein [Dactylosporangium vinaceum]UAB95400.1 hypothetical protein Dvina_46515 [Dactylosporangium vinaceum]